MTARKGPVTIREMTLDDAPAVSALADRLVGQDYYPPGLVQRYLERARTAIGTLSYVAERDGQLVGFRFVLPPGRWDEGRGSGLTPERWPGPLAEAGYFQSCFVDHAEMGRGIGRRLAERAFADLRRVGASLVVAHSWKESPHDSSRRYLKRLGFVAVAEHPRYWAEVEYLCGGCKQPDCVCTAIEMVKVLEPPLA